MIHVHTKSSWKALHLEQSSLNDFFNYSAIIVGECIPLCSSLIEVCRESATFKLIPASIDVCNAQIVKITDRIFSELYRIVGRCPTIRSDMDLLTRIYKKKKPARNLRPNGTVSCSDSFIVHQLNACIHFYLCKWMRQNLTVRYKI